MSFQAKQIITYHDDLYIVHRTFKDFPDFPISDAKDYLTCDIALRKDGYLYFCRKIDEAQIIEEHGEV